MGDIKDATSNLSSWFNKTGVSDFVEGGSLVGQATGLDFKDQAMILAGYGALGQLPGDLGAFFSSDAGQVLTNMLGMTGGVFTDGINSFMSNLGLNDSQKDMVEELAAFAALSYIGNEYAEEAINKAKELEQSETELVRGMVESAKQYNDPKFKQQTIEKTKEEVSQEYGRARETAKTNLWQRGMGELTTGPEAYLDRMEAQDRLKAARDTELQLPNLALQAQSYAAGPLADLSTRAAQTAEEQRMLPLDFYLAMKEANRRSPVEDYYSALLAQQQGAASAAGGGSGTNLAGLIGAGLNIAGLGMGGAGAGNVPQTGTSGGIVPSPGPMMSPQGFSYGWQNMANPWAQMQPDKQAANPATAGGNTSSQWRMPDKYKNKFPQLNWR